MGENFADAGEFADAGGNWFGDNGKTISFGEDDAGALDDVLLESIESLLDKLSGCSPKRICRQFSIRISTTTLANLMSIMAATVSSSSRNKVGPKQTPKLPTVIMFLLALAATLSK